MKYKYVILGNGAAGISAISAIRKNDKEERILLVSNEDYNSYFRIKMSHLIDERENLVPYMKKDTFYEDNQVDTLLETSVMNINPEEMSVSLRNIGSGEETVVYGEKILIAIGGHSFVPPIPGATNRGVFTLKEYQDLINIKEYLTHADKVVIIGGGVLGLEAAESIHRMGKEVHIFEMAPYLMPRQLTEEIALIMQEDLTQLGYHLHLEQNVIEIIGEDSVEKIALGDGSTMEADFILLSTGILPNTSLLDGTAIAVNRGIVVDERMQTSLPGIYAAGDIAEVRGMIPGLWTAAMAMGEVAGANMSEGDKEYVSPEIFTNLKMDEIQLFSAGTVNDAEEVYGYDEGSEHHRLYVTGGKVVGAILYGDTSKFNTFKKIVAQERPLSDVKDQEYPFEKR